MSPGSTAPRKRGAVLLLAAAALIMGCTNRSADASTPAGWVRECPGEAFCFSRPASLVLQPTQAIDSLSARYQGDGLRLVFDMGLYGISVDHLVSPAKESLTIDGRPAQMLFGAHEIALLVPKVHERGGRAVKFSMTLSSDGNMSRQLAQSIFQSVEFKPQR